MLSLLRVVYISVSLLTLGNLVIGPAQAALVSMLQIASGSALVLDMSDNHLLYAAHLDKVVHITSLSKLMTAMVVLDAKQPMDEMISVDIHQTPELRGVFSRVLVGSEIDRHICYYWRSYPRKTVPPPAWRTIIPAVTAPSSML